MKNEYDSEFKGTVLSYVLFFKNEELNAIASLSPVSIREGKPKDIVIPSFKEEQRPKSRFHIEAEAEVETYLAKRGNEVREDLLAYVKTALQRFAETEKGAEVRAAIERDGIDQAAERILYSLTNYLAEWRNEKAMSLVYMDGEGRVYAKGGAEREEILLQVRSYYSSQDDKKEYLSVYEPEERSIVLSAPEILTALDTALALSVVYPKTEYQDFIKNK